MGTAKTQKDARQTPFETDFPRFLLRKSTARRMLREVFRKDARLALHEKRPSLFCVVFPYLSLSCPFGALACYLSILAYPLSHARFSPLGDFGVALHQQGASLHILPSNAQVFFRGFSSYIYGSNVLY